MKKAFWLAGATVLALAQPAIAGDTIKIGFVSTFSGPTAVIGNDMRNSFELALDHLGRKMGGKPVEVIYEDDGQKPDVGKQKTEKLIQSDKVDFIAGYIWSNVLLASLKTAVDSQDLPDLGQCRPVAARRRTVLALRVLDLLAERPDAAGDGPLHEPEGRQVGVPDRPELCRRQGHAGRREEHLQGRGGRRGIYGVAEPARLLRRTHQGARTPRPSRSSCSIRVLPACSSSTNMPRPASRRRCRSIRRSPSTNCRCRCRRKTRSAFPARRNGSTTCRTRENKQFVEDYRKKYTGLRPTYYGAQSYDAAQLINSAVVAVKGDTAKKDAMKAEMEKANFKSLRGPFKYGNNHIPIQNFYLQDVVKDADGQLSLKTVATIVKDDQDRFHDKCPMK